MSKDFKLWLRFVLRYFFRINWIKSIWFNYSSLPISIAYKLPFILSFNCKVKNKGHINISCPSRFGLVTVGIKRLSTDGVRECVVINNKGLIEIQGPIKIHMGAKINVRSGSLLLKGMDTIGSCTKIVCVKQVILGHNVRISWNCQVFDTDFHYLYNLNKNTWYPNTKAVIIGDDVFVGNSCTICKGTNIGDGSVISCCSKVSGDFAKHGQNLLLLGNPAIVVKTDVVMSSSWHPDEEIMAQISLNT